MADNYRGEIWYQVSGDALPSPSLYASVAQAPYQRFSFAIAHQNPPTVTIGPFFSITMAFRWLSVGSWETTADARYGPNIAGGDLDSIGTSQQVLTASGEGAYLNGGFVAIEKDPDLDLVRWITPIGTVQTSLSGIGMNNTNPFYALLLEWEWFVNGSFTVGSDMKNTLHTRAFWSEVAGVRQRGAALTTEQPGSWVNPAWTIATNGLNATRTHTQERDEDRVELDTPAVVIGGTTRISRSWNGGNTIALTPREVDLQRVDEHGLLFRAYGKSDSPEILRVGRSGNTSGPNPVPTWTDVEIATGSQIGGAPAYAQNPSLAWYGGKLYLVYDDGATIVQLQSADLGHSWHAQSGVAAVDIIRIPAVPPATKPRLLVHPSHGLAFYFWIEDGILFVNRSGDFGQTFWAGGPNVVYTGIDDRTYAVWVDAAGFLRVRLNVAGTVEWRVSVDLGETWDTYSTLGAGLDSDAVFDPKSAFSYHVYWNGTTLILAYASADHGILPSPGPAQGTVVDDAEDPFNAQSPAIEMTPDGGAIVSYFTALENLFDRRSFNYARLWED